MNASQALVTGSIPVARSLKQTDLISLFYFMQNKKPENTGFKGCLDGFEPSTSSSTVRRSAVELQAPRRTKFYHTALAFASLFFKCETNSDLLIFS